MNSGVPPHQRADFAEVSDRRQGDESALALVCNGQPCGFAMLRSLGDTGWIYLRYFVVDRHQRGQGLGGVLWAGCRRRRVPVPLGTGPRGSPARRRPDR